MSDPLGRIYRTAGVAEDITEQKRAEKQLAQAQRMEAVGQLTGGIAHDFNNLLTVIMNSLDLVLVHRTDADRTRLLVEGASRAADRGALLTRQLLAFARGQSLSPEIHDVNELLMRSEALYRRACDASIRRVTINAPVSRSSTTVRPVPVTNRSSVSRARRSSSSARVAAISASCWRRAF